MAWYDGGAPDSGGGGLMGMMANPQTAGLMGMAQGLLAASGPSRMPVTMGQAFSNGMQGMQQGYGNALQMQRQMIGMQALNSMLGGGSGAGSAPAAGGPQGAPVTGAPNVGPLSGLSAGMGAYAPPQAAPAPAAASGPAIYGKTPQQLFQQGMMMNVAGIPGGGDLMKIAVEHDPALAMQMPTDISKMGYQGGMSEPDIQAANRAGVAKANYIAPVSARPGGALMMPDGTTRYTLPSPQAGGMWATDAAGLLRNQAGQPFQIGINGASDIAGGMAYAKTSGEGSALPYAGLDRQGNPLPVTNRTTAATQGALPAPLRNNNPGALMPGGKLAQYPDMTTGLQALDANLASYSKSGINTLSGVISKWAPPSENDTSAYIQDVSQRLGIKPDQPIDLGNPAVRHALSTGIMLHENGPGAVFSTAGRAGASSTAQAASDGPMYAAAPMGAVTAANTAQDAPAAQMAKAQGALSDSDDNYQQSREALLHMLQMAHNQNWTDFVPRMLPESAATKLSGDAATYQKLQANFIAMQGKSLGNAGTDASRETLENSVPGYDKPQSAKLNGLTDQLNQLDWRHLKRQALSPIFQTGDPKQYTQTSSTFDNTIKPAMMPQINQYLSLPPGPARTQALQQAIRDPQMKAALDLMVQTGQLK